MAEPQLRPAPNPAVAIMSPFLICPLLTAWSRAKGIDPADVLPCSSMFLMTLLMGMPRLSAAWAMMRMLAWWCGERGVWTPPWREVRCLDSGVGDVVRE